MAKKARQQNPNRKQLVGLAREQLMSRALTIATGLIVGAVIGLVGWGLIKENIVNPRTIVAIVEGAEINGEDFESRARINRQQLVASYLRLVDNYQIFAGNPELQQQLLSQMSLIQFQLETAQVGNSTVNQLVDDELIVLESQKLGIEVSEEEIEAQLQSIFSYYPDGTPTAEELPTQAVTSTLSATQYAIVSETPTSTAVPTSEGTTPTATNSESEADQAEDDTPEATATAYTFDAYQEQLGDYLKIQKSELDLSETALRRLIYVNLVRDKVFLLLTKDMIAVAEQVWARHILVEEEELANDLFEQLSEGADWAELASEHSIDSNSAIRGGDLGWFVFADMVDVFALAAFDLEIGEISSPVASSFGWHIIQSLGHEIRALVPDVFARAQNNVYQDYVGELRNQYEWEIVGENWVSISPDEPDIPLQYRLEQ